MNGLIQCVSSDAFIVLLLIVGFMYIRYRKQ
jgi:hypothetical protein